MSEKYCKEIYQHAVLAKTLAPLKIVNEHFTSCKWSEVTTSISLKDNFLFISVALHAFSANSYSLKIIN